MTGDERQPRFNMHHSTEPLDLTSSGFQHLINNRSRIDSRDGTLISPDASHGQDPFDSLNKIPAILFDKR